MRAAFVGTSTKGPLNVPTLITNPQVYVDTFGEPSVDAYLGYAVLDYFAEGGSSCWVLRTGVETRSDLPPEVLAESIDTSGEKLNGWGRVPLFTGIDNGRIQLRSAGSSGYVFHDAATTFGTFSDAELGGTGTDGPAVATLTFSGTYNGDVDDTFAIIIKSDTLVNDFTGCTYDVVRNSDGTVVATGTLGNDGAIAITLIGVTATVAVSSGTLGTGDIFTFTARPANRSFSFAVEGETPNAYTVPNGTISSAEDLIDALNALVTSEDYVFAIEEIDGVEYPVALTRDSGSRLQLIDSPGFAAEVGVSDFAFDIPRAKLIGFATGPYLFTSSNNRVRLDIVGETTTNTANVTLPTGSAVSVSTIVNTIHAAGVIGGTRYFECFELTVPNGTTHVVIATTADNEFDFLSLKADFSNISTLRFAETLNITPPYSSSYRGYSSTLLQLPEGSVSDPTIPLSCEIDGNSSQCSTDSTYYSNIVGWLVAATPGTWVNGYRVVVEKYNLGLGERAGRFQVSVISDTNELVERLSDVSFDKTDSRYIGSLINPGTTAGGIDGNAWINWIERPSYIGANSVRLPSYTDKSFDGQADGVPSDAQYSNLLDAAVIGSQQFSTGMYAFENPEEFDFKILAAPGFSTGAVILAGLQIVENRGDSIFLVDPPFGLRPQQVVDWHNGLLSSDLLSALNTNVGTLYETWLYIFDQYTANYIWVPPSGKVAGAFARASQAGNFWTPPVGEPGGRLSGVIKTQFPSSRPTRDVLYGDGNSVNPIINIPRRGVHIFGQRTLLRGESPLSRLSVQLLAMGVKKDVSEILTAFNFRPNNRLLWDQIRSVIDPYLSDIQARGGIEAYNVIVDETNNTPARIARRETWVSIPIVPVELSEVIVVNIGLTRAGTTLSTVQLLDLGVVN